MTNQNPPPAVQFRPAGQEWSEPVNPQPINIARLKAVCAVGPAVYGRNQHNNLFERINLRPEVQRRE